MITTGQVRKYNWKRYYEQLENMDGPVLPSELPRVKIDIRGALAYAKEKGVEVASLSDEEKKLFMAPI